MFDRLKQFLIKFPLFCESTVNENASRMRKLEASK